MADIVFADSETRTLCSVVEHGAYRHGHHPSTDVLVWGYVFDDEPSGEVWSPNYYWGNSEQSHYDPETPERLLDHINEGGYLVAWNAFFDRHVWNGVMVSRYGWPYLKRDQVLCAQAQAEANNLPGKLEKACLALGTQYKKDKAGARLIGQLCMGHEDDWDVELFESPGKMGHFRAYCLRDCTSMRDVWQHTRPLTLDEWREYHACEEINDRGVMVDYEFAEAAQKYAHAESADINEQLLEVTGDRQLTVTNHLRKAKWLHTELWPDPELQAAVSRPEKEEGKARFSADRATRELVLEVLSQPEHAERFEDAQRDRVVRFLELIEAGNSAAVRKFTAIRNQVSDDGRIRGQYSFNGAGQTGRYSSRGVQIHNLIRDPVKKKSPDRAIDAIEDIMEGVPAPVLVDRYGFPMSRLLARLIRPTFIAQPGKTLVWSDWDQIEARVLPWLANTKGAELKLDLFRGGEDVYRHAALPIFNLDHIDQVDDSQRQVGKVAELALGFGGAAGAFAAMGRGYGVVIPEMVIKDIVRTWRVTNQWCVDYWHILWDAAMSAYRNPGVWHTAGRVKYLYHPGLMRGALICMLPCGRWLVYPQFRHVQVVSEDDRGRPRTRWETSFVRGFGANHARIDLWYGMLAENATQGFAASFLRHALVALRDITVLHTHDEIVVECEESQVDNVSGRLSSVMTKIQPWATGLPLTVSIEHGPFYTK